MKSRRPKPPKLKLQGELCEYCDGKLSDAVSDEKFKVGRRAVLLKRADIGICTTCGEKYYSAATSRRIDALIRRVRRKKPKPVRT